MHYTLKIDSSIDGQLGWFHILAVFLTSVMTSVGV